MSDWSSRTREERTQMATEVYAATGEILGVVLDVGNGNLDRRLELAFPEHHPVGALASSVNAMIAALAEARAETETYQRDLEEKLATIEKQRAAIRDLSTPIIEVWKEILCLPIVGTLDSERASEMTNALLHAIVEKKARFTIIDITGIELMDTRATDGFIRMARSVRLLGAECLLSGVGPNIARTIVHMGVEFGDIRSHRSLRDALRYCVRVLPRRRRLGDRRKNDAQSK